MELELLFSDQKWNILKCLSENKYSPIQLAEKLNTSTANISQQMRLLEAANLVKKEKIKNRDKGKPRTLFSLTEDYAYLIPAMNGFADKKLLKVQDHHKIILKIWFLENPDLHPQLEYLCWKIEPYLANIDAIAVNKSSKIVIIVSNKRDEIMKIAEKNKSINVEVFSIEEAESYLKHGKKPLFSIIDLAIIHDRNKIFSKKLVPV
ncbi:MAG: winged helix-turn-helix domain-containing protein [Nanoarchaeota archaeon]